MHLSTRKSELLCITVFSKKKNVLYRLFQCTTYVLLQINCRLYCPHTNMGIDKQHIHYRGLHSQQQNEINPCDADLHFHFCFKTSLCVCLVTILDKQWHHAKTDTGIRSRRSALRSRSVPPVAETLCPGTCPSTRGSNAPSRPLGRSWIQLRELWFALQVGRTKQYIYSLWAT